MTFLDYAPAPESQAILNLRSEYGLFIGGEFARRQRHTVLVDLARDGEAPRDDRAPRPTADVDAAVAAARKAYDKTWSRLSGADRGKYLFRIARLVQERAARARRRREPRQRQADQGVARRRRAPGRRLVLLLRRLGRQARPRRPRRVARAAGRGRAGHPVELPAAHARVEDRAGAGRRQHRGAQARRDHVADRAAVRRDRAAGRPARRASSTSSPAPATPVPRSSVTPTWTRSPSPGRPPSAARSPSRSPARGKKLTLELGGKAANIVFDDAPIDQAIEGIVNGIFFNQGHVCCAGSRLLVQESVHDEVVDRLKARLSTLRLGDPLDKNTDIGAINSAEQLERIRDAERRRRRRGRGALDRGVRDPGQRVLVRADDLHQRLDEPPDRPRGDLRTRAVRADVPHAGRGRRQGQQHPVRPVRGHLDRQGQPHPGRRRQAARRRHLGQHVQPVRPVEPVRRLQGVRLRPRGRPARHRRLPVLERSHA